MVCPGRSIESIRKKPQTIQAGPRAVRLAAAGLLRFQDLASPPPSYLRDPGRVTSNFSALWSLHHEGARVKKKHEYCRMPARRHWAESTSDSASLKRKRRKNENRAKAAEHPSGVWGCWQKSPSLDKPAESPPPPPTAGPTGGEGATVLLNRATASSSATAARGAPTPSSGRTPPRAEVRKTMRAPGAAREERPRRPDLARAGEPGPPRGLAQVQPPWPADRLRLRRRLGGAGDPAPPPPRTHPAPPGLPAFASVGAALLSPARLTLPRRRSPTPRRTSRAASAPGAPAPPRSWEAGVSRTHSCRAAPTTARPRTARARAALSPPDGGRDSRSGHSQPARKTTEPSRHRADPRRGRGGPGSGRLLGSKGRGARGLWALALRCILGSVVLAERGLGSRVELRVVLSPPREFKAQGSSKIGFIRGRQFVCKQSHNQSGKCKIHRLLGD